MSAQPQRGVARQAASPAARPRLWLYGSLVALAAFYALPVCLLALTSVKPFEEVSLSRMWDLPRGVSVASFGRAWEVMRGSFANSLLMVIPATVGSCLLGSLNGYVLAKWRFRGADGLFAALLLGMFIPDQSVLIPLVEVLRRLHLYGSLPGLGLVHVVYGIPITTLLFRNYYAGVPTEVVEAGKIDGAGFFGIYRYLVFPLSTPGFVVAAIWQFTSIWNEFLFGFIITSSPAQRPVTVALQNLSGSQYTQWNVQMAGALLVALPTLLVYVLLGRYFLRGLLAGSLKG